MRKYLRHLQSSNHNIFFWSGQFCLIHDLFYPASNSVTCTYNTLISLYYKVSYDSVEIIIKIFEQFGGASLKLTAI